MSIYDTYQEGLESTALRSGYQIALINKPSVDVDFRPLSYPPGMAFRYWIARYLWWSLTSD
ncbi:hypothetical protein BY996DRAFT_6445254 [Phakopsora pachyrhizi]|nr:hypothetical protein BY996DRAFT_6445254 [Phakopsora pachyrhizi]